MIKCLASLTFDHFSSNCLINSIIKEHTCKVLYISQGSSVEPTSNQCFQILVDFMCLVMRNMHRYRNFRKGVLCPTDKNFFVLFLSSTYLTEGPMGNWVLDPISS